MSNGSQIIHLTLAWLLQGFDIAIVGNMPVDIEEEQGPLEVVLKPRLSEDLYQCH